MDRIKVHYEDGSVRIVKYDAFVESPYLQIVSMSECEDKSVSDLITRLESFEDMGLWQEQMKGRVICARQDCSLPVWWLRKILCFPFTNRIENHFLMIFLFVSSYYALLYNMQYKELITFTFLSHLSLYIIYHRIKLVKRKDNFCPWLEEAMFSTYSEDFEPMFFELEPPTKGSL